MVKWKLKNGKEVYLDGYLKTQLDSIVCNLKNDWDFVIIITGDGMVRVGKSWLAIQICSYLADRIGTPYNHENIFFDSKDMINFAQQKTNTLVHYDEAREGLATSKRFTKVQEDLMDYFNECGQRNNIFVLVLPDYFSLNAELSTNRSECLINVYRTERPTERMMMNNEGVQEKTSVVMFERGSFEFYNRKRKHKLYFIGKRSGLREYGMVKPNFRGSFTNDLPIDEELYRQRKKEALARFETKHKEELIKKKTNRFEKGLFKLLRLFAERKELKKISQLIGEDHSYLGSMAYELRKAYPEFAKEDDFMAKSETGDGLMPELATSIIDLRKGDVLG